MADDALQPGDKPAPTVDVLKVQDLEVHYGGIRAVRGLSLRAAAGSTTCILGRNGAGKSSLVRAVVGLERYGGAIEFNGRDIARWRTWRRQREGIALVPEDRRIIGPLTVRENLTVAGPRDRRQLQERLDEAKSTFPELIPHWNRLGGSLSGGQQQMLAIARALMGSPRLLILDEPSLGLAPLVVQSVYTAIRRITNTGLSVLLIEQSVPLALSVAKHVYVMNHGGIVAEGTPEEFDDTRIYEHYL